MANRLHKEGTAATVIGNPAQPDWTTNSSEYIFPPAERRGLSLAAKKTGDRKLHVTISGPYKRSFTFVVDMPTNAASRVEIAVAWKKKEVDLYLNGRLVSTQKA